jgi:hypothetical protein
MSSLVAGAEMMTFFTVAPRCALALVASVKWPVDSTTISAPVEAQSSLAGSRSAKTLIFLPSTVMKSSPATTSFFEVAEDRVVLEKMGEDCGAGEVVYGDEFDFRVTQSCAENVAADAAEAVNANLDCHVVISPYEFLQCAFAFAETKSHAIACLVWLGVITCWRSLPPNPSDYHCCQQEQNENPSTV